MGRSCHGPELPGERRRCGKDADRVEDHVARAGWVLKGVPCVAASLQDGHAVARCDCRDSCAVCAPCRGAGAHTFNAVALEVCAHCSLCCGVVVSLFRLSSVGWGNNAFNFIRLLLTIACVVCVVRPRVVPFFQPAIQNGKNFKPKS